MEEAEKEQRMKTKRDTERDGKGREGKNSKTGVKGKMMRIVVALTRLFVASQYYAAYNAITQTRSRHQ